MKKPFVAAKGPVGEAIKLVLTTLGAEVAETPETADLVLVSGRAETLDAIESQTLPIWQVGLGRDRVIHRRVRVFDALEGNSMLTLLGALKE